MRGTVELGQVESVSRLAVLRGQGQSQLPSPLPPVVLSLDLCCSGWAAHPLHPAAPSSTGSHIVPSLREQEIKNDSSFPGTLETTGELAEARES